MNSFKTGVLFLFIALIFFHLMKLPDRPCDCISTSVGFPGIPPLESLHCGGTDVKRLRRKQETLKGQATTSTSVRQNGQPGGGGSTGGVPPSSNNNSWTLHPSHWSREAELLQLQRSDTRWGYLTSWLWWWEDRDGIWVINCTLVLCVEKEA